MPNDFDLAVIGAGFGGLGLALRAAELGLRVVVLETLTYPGGCASTYRRGGATFESGATLFSGLHAEGYFGRALAAHGIPLEVDWLDPVFHVRTPHTTLAVPRDRAAQVAAWQALEPAHEVQIARFFAAQHRLADTLWTLFEEPTLLPPFSLRAGFTHLTRLPRYVELVPWLGRSLADMLEAFGLARALRLRAYLDALCQITVQVPAAEAEAAFALAAIDYTHRGTGHVRGGIGELAKGMVRAIEHAGGEVRFTSRVTRVERSEAGFVLHGRREPLRATRLGANLLPADVARLFGTTPHALGPLGGLHDAVQTGWSAVMLYRVVRDEGLLEPGAHHVDLTLDPAAPLDSGNHVFCSVSAGAERRAGLAERTVTMSTHVPARLYASRSGSERAHYVERVQDAMRRTVSRLYPALDESRVRESTASPRTFQRFVGRSGGAVGGIPRRVGFQNYGQLGPTSFLPNAWLVGDSVFPGQSILSTAIGGQKTAEACVGRR